MGYTSAGIIVTRPSYSTAPAFFTGLTPEKWTQVGVSLNTANISGGPAVGTDANETQTCFAAWTGPVMDSDEGEMLFLANQGHADGSWNGVFGFKLIEDTPTWRLRAAVASNLTEQGDGTVVDGSPASTHSYGFQCYDPVTKLVFQPARGGIAPSGAYRGLISTWDRTIPGGSVRGWDTSTYGAETWSGSSGSDFATYGGCDYDPVSDRVLAVPAYVSAEAGGIMVIDAGAESVSYSDTVNAGDSGQSMLCCAGSKGVAAMLWDSGRLRVWDTSDLASNYLFDATPSNGPTLDPGPDIVWHEASDAYLVRAGTSKDLYKLKPTSWSDLTTGWAYTSVATDAAGATPDAHYSNGSFGKFRIIPDMGNGEACLVLIPKETSTPLVMRLTGSL